MLNLQINYPSFNYKNYIESVYEFCKNNKFSLILKGSLAKGTATKFSDIDLIILGNLDSSKVDEIISLYGNPVMTNFTENPKGILILVYQDSTSVDLEIRETIFQKDLENSIVLLRYDENFIIDNKNIIRKQIESNYMPNRPEWYKVLRLLHRGTIKYLSNKTRSAYELLDEIKEALISLGIRNLSYSNNFEEDIKLIFHRFCREFQVDSQIKGLFHNLFKEFSLRVIDNE
ncbi:nucleotidyltransferase domain-containing protein [Clostridium sp. UBA4548]|uniref:nucleotidyltransferase domain-containing protein n=1 Tax=Clostridium sp. UBA4548 TaxID=1946361 RepID=UPI0025C079F0|nr:nucleotidyltransferase domain-containing protein [Clostridium sp. UBA4548]